MTEPLTASQQVIQQNFYQLDDPIDHVTDQERGFYDSYVHCVEKIKTISDLNAKIKIFSSTPYTFVVGGESRSFEPVSLQALESDWLLKFQELYKDGQITTEERGEVRTKLESQNIKLKNWVEKIEGTFSHLEECLATAHFFDFMGRSVTIRNLPLNGPYVFSYFFKDCPPCLQEIKKSVEFAKTHPFFQAVFVNVVPSDSFQSIAAKLAKIGIATDQISPNIIFLNDNGSYKTMIPKGLSVVPISFVIDSPGGKVLSSHVGYDETIYNLFNGKKRPLEIERP